MAVSARLTSKGDQNSEMFLVPDFGPSRRKRQENWTTESTLALLNIWRENIVALRSVKRNGHIYQKIAHELHLAGFHRTRFEVKTKIGNLTNEYRRERRRLQAEGGGGGGGRENGRSSFKFWDVVHEMMTADVSPAVVAFDGSTSREGFEDDDDNDDSALCNGDGLVFPATSQPVSLTSDWSPVEHEFVIKQELQYDDEEEEEVEEKSSFATVSRPRSLPPSSKTAINDTTVRPKSRKRKFRTEDQRLKIMNLIYEETRRMNRVTQRAENEALSLMREQIDLQRQSMFIEERIAKAIEGACRELTSSLSQHQCHSDSSSESIDRHRNGLL